MALKGAQMKLFVFVLACFAIGFAAPADQKSPGEGTQKKSAPQSKSNRQVQESMTGCVDEQDGNYVLLDDKMEKKLADLEAVGASNEAFFAKHLGHTVTVKGRKPSEQDPKFRVSSVEDIAPVCAPRQGANPQ
jgi:hypothetical protein